MYEKFTLGTTYFFEAGDIWPEAPIQLGFLKNPFLKSLARQLEKQICINASKLIGLSPGITAHLQSISGRSDILTVTNFSEPESLMCKAESFQLKESLGIDENDFIIAYTGTIGFANHLEFLIDLASVIPDDFPIRIIIMGEGAQKDQLKKYAQSKGVDSRVLFVPKGDRSEVACMLKISHAAYISFARAPVLQTGSPNKFFDAIATGKMVIANFGGWIANLISEHRIGFTYDPGEPEEAFNKLLPFISNKESLKGIAVRARSLAGDYDIKTQTRDLIHEIRNIKKAG
jgi:glycosyltransferase involved in cell wall biosynthesis